MNSQGFVIFIGTIFEGSVPAVTESFSNDLPDSPERIRIFATKREAQLEIVDNMMTKLQQFIDGERDFEDAVTLEEYVVEITLDDKTILHH